MIRDFRPVVAYLKALNNFVALRTSLGSLSLPVMDGEETPDEVLNLIIYNTDRAFLPLPSSRIAAMEVIKLHQNENEAYKHKMVDLIEQNLSNVGKYLDSYKSEDEVLDLGVSIAMLDDVIEYYRSGNWRGKDFSLQSLIAKYSAREAWLAKDIDKCNEILKLMPKDVRQSEMDSFYMRHGW